MDRPSPVPPFRRPPGICRHRRVLRIGIQEAPAGPMRLYLVTCRECGTTLTTETLRRERTTSAAPPPRVAG